jgi:hypothetical protein
MAGTTGVGCGVGDGCRASGVTFGFSTMPGDGDAGGEAAAVDCGEAAGAGSVVRAWLAVWCPRAASAGSTRGAGAVWTGVTAVVAAAGRTWAGAERT